MAGLHCGPATPRSRRGGLHPLDSGDVSIHGTSLVEAPELRRSIGFAAQAESLYPLLTGRENLGVFGRLSGFDRRLLRGRIDHLAERLRLTAVLDQPVRALSGGERRRVHVAVALLGDSPVVLLDEPTAGVDPVTRSDVLALIAESAQAGAMVLHSTHYLHEVEQLDGTVVMLERGRVVASGTVPSLLAQHGRSSIHMEFAEPVDTSDLPWTCDWRDQHLVIKVGNARAELPRILERLDGHAVNLRSLEVREPDLESVFFSLTGRKVVESEGLGDIDSV